MSIIAATENARSTDAALAEPTARPMDFHRRLPGYRATPLVDAGDLAARLGVNHLLVKDESSRLGLPSFKILGASWAICRLLEKRVGQSFDQASLEDIAVALQRHGPMTLVAATDGNHGRGVAHMARLLGMSSHIFVPANMVPARIEAIRGEGATVTVVDGTYDDAIEQSAAEESENRLVVSDTSWEGYEQVPRWIVDGYSTILWEIDAQLARRDLPAPDVVLVQIGVGAFASAVTRHYRRADLRQQPMLIGVEPESADCVRASIEAGRLVTLPGPHRSVMSGLNTGVPSRLALPELAGGVDLFLTITDHDIPQATRALHRTGVEAGETGTAGIACLMAIREDPAFNGRVATDANVLVIVTEGATDPTAYQRIIATSASGS